MVKLGMVKLHPIMPIPRKKTMDTQEIILGFQYVNFILYESVISKIGILEFPLKNSI